MPWTMFARMTERDIGARYAYLRTVPAAEQNVKKITQRKTNSRILERRGRAFLILGVDRRIFTLAS